MSTTKRFAVIRLTALVGCLLLFACGGEESTDPGQQQPSPAFITLGSVTTGQYFTCGLTAGGVAYCWGANFYGQLGTSTTETCSSGSFGACSTRPVAVSGGLTFDLLDAGIGEFSFHACGLASGSSAYCWGYNRQGQLGDGTTVNRSMPVLVEGEHTFASLSTGSEHACGLTPEGAAYCWGSNVSGELGAVSTDQCEFGSACSQSPVPVSGGLSFVSLNAGASRTCGLTSEGAAYCWGWNFYGQLGDGSTVARSTPVPVVGGLDFASVSLGWSHTCGVLSDGTAYCWGDNRSGQLGDGSTTDRMTPVAVSGGLRFASLSAGFSYTCAVTVAGAGYCWGDNRSGQLGDGSTSNRTSPDAVSGGLSFASVSTAFSHACGVTTSGAAYC